MLVIAIINAFIGGGCNPARILLVRDSFGEVSDNDVLKDMAEGFRDKVKWLGMIAAIGGICCYIFCMIFIIIGAKISYELKWRYLKAVLSQDCAWYERQNIEELPTQINVNIAEVENAIGKTSGFIIYSFGALCAGVGIAFFIGGVLACTYLAIIPCILICGMSRGKLLSKGNEEIEKAYEKSGADAEEALQNIRVVKAFGQESSEINKFVNHLSQADNKVHKYSFLFGITCGMVESVLYVIQSYALMIGGFIIAGGVTNKNVDRTYNLGDAKSASVSIFIGALFFGASAMNIQTLKRGLVCAGSILHVIDRVPPININDPDAESFNESIEEIKLENVSFKYEGRNNKVLDHVSLNFKNSKMTALVGPSGCGKSTIVRLLERFYDPTEGKIFVNSKDLKTLNLQQYRRKIGYVGQEPCLLNETIKDNLLNGNPDATDAEIIEALKLAHACDFVMKLPRGIETNVGGVGGKLSGGQKQRIAIARALLKKPDLLILDEATSALDSENERAVQAAIDNIGRTHSITTVVIAHRLSTIFNSDFIYVLNEGKVVEMGDHKSLINEKGLYYSYFKSQEISNSVFNKKQNKIDEDVDKSGDKILLVENHVKVDDQKEMGSLEILKKLLPYSNPKILIFVLFITCSIVAAALSIIAIYIVKCLFAYLRHTPNHMRTEMSKYCSVIFGVGVLVFTLQAINRYSLQIFSFSMTKMIRQDLYKSLINQSIPFYEKKKNSTGQLTGILAKDSRVVNGASFELYILVFQGFVGNISGVVVGFIHEWNLGLVILGLLPSTAFCAYFLLVVQVTPPPKASKYTDYERTVISDSISNYSTILSLAYQDKYVERYYDCDEKRDRKMDLKVDLWRTHWFCVAYGASNSLINGYVIPMLYVMASNVEDGNSICDQFICLVVGIFGSLSLSLAMFNAPDYNKGKESAIEVFKMINRPQEGEQASLTPNGSRDISPDEANGDIEFHNVWFKYPSSEVWVLKDFSFKINCQESVGFVGESGCGKSTVTLLLLRFYEPNKGFITIGNTKITEFSMKSLRSIFGLVQQEPIIFNCSIMENIVYGKPYATAEEVKKAAELANASSFIDKLTSDKNFECKSFEITTNETDPRYSELSEGYKIICGHKGAKLSGGQKQCIAIARALIRNPRILLLDEATSALDEKTQVEVQQTLDEISNTTTSIVIAHRKSTLSNCDKIVQIYDGVIMNSN